MKRNASIPVYPVRIRYRGVRITLDMPFEGDPANLMLDPDNPTEAEIGVLAILCDNFHELAEKKRQKIIKLLEKNNESERFEKSFGWNVR